MYSYNPTPPSDTLMHYGIKGQKWGVRRYQNKDGSYTNAGKTRYSVFGMRHDVKKARKAAQKENVSGRSKKSTGVNYDKAVAKNRQNKKTMENRRKELEKKGYDSFKSDKDFRKAWSKFDSDNRKSISRGREAINKAMLKDAGYTQDEIRGGMEYLKKRGIRYL